MLLAARYDAARNETRSNAYGRYVAMTMHDPRNVVRGLEIHYSLPSLKHRVRQYNGSLTMLRNIPMVFIERNF